jgi:hypothetical protein
MYPYPNANTFALRDSYTYT